MDKCSRCGGTHPNLDCLYYNVTKKNYFFNSNIVLQISNSHVCSATLV